VFHPQQPEAYVSQSVQEPASRREVQLGSEQKVVLIDGASHGAGAALAERHTLSRRGFCMCCAVAAGFTSSGGWLSPSQAFAEARNVVDLIRDSAAKTPITVHKLRGNVSILEGSGGNIAVLTGADGKLFIDAGITVTRPRILEDVNNLSRDPIKHLINTHWHFDHTDGNQWLNEEGAAILAHENTHKHLLSAQRVETGTSTSPHRPWRRCRPSSSRRRRPSASTARPSI